MKALPLRLALVLVPLFGVSTSAHAQPRMPTHVACVGDSITKGDYNSAGKDWSSDLHGLLGGGVDVKGFGANGTTMLSVTGAAYKSSPAFTNAKNFVSGAGAGAVIDVIIMLGTNDSKPASWTPNGKPKQDQQFLADAGAMVDAFLNLPTKPVVYLALPPSAYANTFTIDGKVIHDEELALLLALAATKGLPLIDVNTPTFVPDPASLFVDGVHPNDAGAAVIAQVMHDGLLRVPGVSITAPLDGASVAGPLTLGADASGGTVAITQVELFDGSSSLGVAKQMKSPFSIDLQTLSVGDHSVTAKARGGVSRRRTR